MEGAELSDSTSNSMDRLMEYLDSNFITLHDNLNDDNFQRILMVIWEIMAEILCQLVENNLEVELYNYIFSRMNTKNAEKCDNLIRAVIVLPAEETTAHVLLESPQDPAHAHTIFQSRRGRAGER